MDNLVDLYCVVDDFCQFIIPALKKVSLPHSSKQRNKSLRLSMSEIMTIMIHFHQSHYRDFKSYYIHHVMQNLKKAFPDLVSYSRFVERMPSVLLLLCLFIPQAKTFTALLYRFDIYRSVIINGPHLTESLKGSPKNQNQRWAGFMALNCILSSTIKVSC